MPFTPFHMGPAIFIKALLQGSFSLMVFGWSQIIMDIQPLVVLLTQEGRLHRNTLQPQSTNNIFNLQCMVLPRFNAHCVLRRICRLHTQHL